MIDKPLGRKAFGHIPHLPGSRMGPGDHHCHEGQAKIATGKARDRHDIVIVTEKLDGSCCAVAKIEGKIIPLNRSGYRAETSPYEHHRIFADWVYSNYNRFDDALTEGMRLVGEWLALAHGTRYRLTHEPFVVFEALIADRHQNWNSVQEICAKGNFVMPAVLHTGVPLSVDDAKLLIRESRHGAIDPVEGAVWRVERRDSFDFLCKWVRPEKTDGTYLPEISGAESVWNWKPGSS